MDLNQQLLGVQPAFSAITVEVTEASSDVAICRAADGRRFTLPVTSFYSNRSWEIGGRYHVVLTGSSGVLEVSAIRDELPAFLLEGVCPEVRDGRVRVMGSARRPGVRCKVAVAATEPDIDPIGAALGKAAGRVKLLASMMHNERIDVVAWHPQVEKFAVNALAVSAVSSETVDETIVVKVPRHQFAAALGGGNLNVSLASQLVGSRIHVVAV